MFSWNIDLNRTVRKGVTYVFFYIENIDKINTTLDFSNSLLPLWIIISVPYVNHGIYALLYTDKNANCLHCMNFIAAKRNQADLTDSRSVPARLCC